MTGMTTLHLTANHGIATLIAVGYMVTMFGMWYVRKSYDAIASMGWLLFPVLTLWSLFYLGIVFINGEQRDYQEWFIWISRFGHFMQIMILVIVIIIGRNIAASRKHE